MSLAIEDITEELQYNLNMLRRDLIEEFQPFCDFNVEKTINSYFNGRDLSEKAIKALFTCKEEDS